MNSTGQAFPLRIGAEESFAAVRGFLTASGYSEQFLLDRFSLPSLHFLLYPLGQQGDEFRKRYQGPGLQLLLSRLLMGGYAATETELAEHLPPRISDAMRDLGLLLPMEGEPPKFITPALVYPALGFFIAADRGFYLEGVLGYRGSDYVMSGTEHVCRDYVDSLPLTACGRFLEIGTGSALGALWASRTAGHVWATDITERAAHYARFNSRLNGAANFTVAKGDLFEPVKGLTFDRIACNPPFEPPLKRGLVFSVGGEDGEQIMKRLVEQAPRYLNPGGRLYMQVMGTNREDESFDARIRKWLGEASAECDFALFARQVMQPREYAIQQILGENDDSWKLEEWSGFYKKLRAYEVVHGHLVIQRRESERPVFHAVRKFGPSSGLAAMEWLVDWETRCVQPGHEAFLMAARPVAGPAWELEVRHTLRQGKLAPIGYTMKTKAPFDVDLQIQPWIAATVARCDGSHTCANLLEWVRGNGALSGDEGPAEFVRAMNALIGCDFLRVEDAEQSRP
ncbi:MAG: methyltransferase [Bryobacteraceae bacterium]|nr:methyltransferase [Bryobacteraceae bacterium]